MVLNTLQVYETRPGGNHVIEIDTKPNQIVWFGRVEKLGVKKVLLLGSAANLSRETGLALRDSLNLHWIGVVLSPVATGQPPFNITPVTLPGSLQDLAGQVGLPCLTFDPGAESDFARDLHALDVELIVSSCFPCRVPAWMTGRSDVLPLNLHPSLLPRYRGPEPLFWQFRNAEPDTGVTLHRLEPELDAGSILLQCTQHLPPEIDVDSAERLLAHRAVSALDAWAGRGGEPCLTPQDHSLATAQPLPGPEDYILHSHWSALRAYRFAMAYQQRVAYLTVQGEGVTLRFRHVTGWGEGRGKEGVRQTGSGEARIGFKTGYLDVRL